MECYKISYKQFMNKIRQFDDIADKLRNENDNNAQNYYVYIFQFC
jgi:hypothetical protein